MKGKPSQLQGQSGVLVSLREMVWRGKAVREGPVGTWRQARARDLPLKEGTCKRRDSWAEEAAEKLRYGVGKEKVDF